MCADPDQCNCGRPACACPINRIPAAVWEKLGRRSFRQRHPVLWWCGLFALLLLIAFALRAYFDNDGGEERIALIRISGPIMDPGPTLAWIRRVENNAAAKGALIRVDSPGGGAAASQEIYAALLRLGKKIPIAVSMGATAASGGLMVSMAGKRVFANPSTVTGSIGVRMDIPQLQGLMGKLGIGQETLVTAPFKDAASYMHPLTQEDRAYLETVLMNMHDQFVAIVAKGRNMPLEQARKLANGKIYTGQEALGLGLVDELGGQDDAQDWLAAQTGVPRQRKLLERPVSRTRMLEQLLTLGQAGLDLADRAASPGGLTQPAFLYQ
ncbi:MAG: signal peptide peptidase SppA [Desulfovibrio sp.]|nr:signal peptide peptidase SppA [Desulfovibrio sp.]